MNSFNLRKISHTTEAFIARNKRLGYQIDKVQQDERSFLYRAVNLFSLLYCRITNDVDVIKEWKNLQETLFEQDRSTANRYLVHVVPDSIIKRFDLYEELAQAEQDDRFFRKVFIGLPDSPSKVEIENALRDRIPLWFEERTTVIRQYVPVLSELVPDSELLRLLVQKTPSVVVKTIEKQPEFSYLFEGAMQRFKQVAALQVNAESDNPKERGFRITGLTVQDFRRFENRSFDLNGDVVLVYGRNGTGKTTLCDALELSIFPELRRLQGDPDTQIIGETFIPLIRAGSISECAQIRVTGNAGADPFLLLTTVSPNTTQKELNGKSVTQDAVLRFLTGNENVNKKGFQDILLHTHFLGQHSIRDFIYGNRLDDSEKITTTRYNLLAEMFGFGEVEHLKKRLTNILTQIKRSKVNEAERNVEAARVQIRGMQRKYGPKSRRDLEKKGYEILPKHALQKYREVSKRLVEALGADTVAQIIIINDEPMESYRTSCESARSLLSAELKALEAQATDVKRLGRLIAKMNAMLGDMPQLHAVSVTRSVEEVRRRIEESIRKVEQAQREIQTIDFKIETLDSNIVQLQQFSKRHERYLELLAMERNEGEALNSMQKQRNDLLNQQGELLIELEKAKARQKEAEKLVTEKAELIRSYERLLESFGEARAAEIRLQQQTSRLAILEATILQVEQKRLQLKDPSVDTSPTESPVDWEVFHTDTHYICPCCGATYDDSTAFEQSIHQQLTSGKYREALRDFIAHIASRNAEAVRAHLGETISAHNREKTDLQKAMKLQTRIVTAFKSLTDELGEVGTLSEKSLREKLRQHQQELEGMQLALASHGAKSLNERADEINEKLDALSDESHSEHLRKIRIETLQLTSYVRDAVPEAELLSMDRIRTRLDGLSTELLECKTKRERLLEEVAANTIPEAKLREMDECISEFESLSLNQDALRGFALDTAPTLSEENLAKQKSHHALSKEIEDLSKVFGLLSVEERSDTLTSAIEGYEEEKTRWKTCYQNIERINTDLSNLSYSGLQQSLAEYGPLINQIYQKFIRHDIFASLVLEPDVSRKARRNDLYLKLKSYSGETKYTPASYLSESQLNILALSIFLTRVMYQNISQLETVFIDDPIQQMDDMNAAAFVDVILGLSQIGKQIIITTCNQDFYRLVAYKMRGVSSTGSVVFKTIDLDFSSKSLVEPMQTT